MTNASMMNKVVPLLGIFLLSIAGCAQFEDRGKKLKELVEKKDCDGAERYAQNMAADDGKRYSALGGIELQCRRNRVAAIKYFKLGAINGDKHSISALIRLGEEVPEPPKVIYKDRVIESPPPTQPQEIIIQQQRMSNPNACIQDGGPIFCPNHPNTRR
jgi:hypothetical protein